MVFFYNICKKNLKVFIRDIKTSVVLHLLLSLLVLPLVVFISKYDSLLYINRLHHPFLDELMYHLTRLPELALIVFAIILGLFCEKRVFIAIVVSLLISLLVIYLSKFVFFTDFKRPLDWINKNPQVKIHFNPKITLHTHSSFPSGHTISAFCCLSSVAFVSKKGWVQLLLFILAALMGLSRVYVLQHYLIDIYVGAMLGFWITFLVHFYFKNNLLTPFWLQPFIK